MNDQAQELVSGMQYGREEEFGTFYALAQESDKKTAVDIRRFYSPGPMFLTTPHWTTTLSEISIVVETVDQFRFKCMFRFVVDTPVHAATDHPEWSDDVVLVWSFYTTSEAHITSATHTFRRGCGRYLREVPNQFYASQVAWPVRNIGDQESGAARLGGSFRTRVTAC